jgi:deazaflavin-dependent oxidoreductase (nitroreductase family)
MSKTYKVTFVVRIVNFLAERLVDLNVGPRHRYLLTVHGRRTGRPYTTPVAIVDHGTKRYLVAPYGEVAWVRNVRAHGRATIRRGRHAEQVTISEVPVGDRPPILQKYLALEPITRAYFLSSATSPVEDFRQDAAAHPVFLVT